MKPLFLLLLLAAGVAILSWPRQPVPPVVRVPVPVRPTATDSHRTPPTGFRQPPPREQFATPWAALEAGDHAAFITLLREAGCPEESVHVFALAAVGRAHQQRLEQPLREAIRSSKYWQISWEVDGGGGETLSQRIQQARAALDQDITRLLGISADVLRRRFVAWEDGSDSMIPEEQSTVFAQLSADQEAERRGLADSPLFRGVYGQMLDPGGREHLRELRERQRQELAGLLGAEAAEQYELRFSPEAEYVRQVLPAARDEEEFRRMVAAARAVGVDRADAMADQMQQHMPISTRGSFPSVRDQVLERFRETTDPDRRAEIEWEQAEEQRRDEEARRRDEEERQARREAASLADLADLAQAGGVELTDTEVRELAAAIRHRGTELDREWGQPPAHPTPEERARWEHKLREELERVAIATVGERGRVIVEQMVKRQSGEQP